MNDMQRYIVEEWAEDYREGRLGRREFVRRIAMMSGGAALAAPVLQTLGVAATPEEIAEAASSQASVVAQATGVTVRPDDPAIQAELLTFPSGQTTVYGYLARPRAGGPAPGVVVIHENRGMLEHFKDISRRLAKAGYVGLAVDLASPVGGTDAFSDLSQVSTALGQTPPAQHVVLLNDGVRYLQTQSFVRRDRVGAMGFCFGGGITWRLATQNPDLRAAVPFYGTNPPLEDVPKIRAAILAIYGELDARVNAGIPAIRDAMRRANVVHDIVIYPRSNHAFFNDTFDRYNPDAARDAWQRTLAWFERYLKG
ncbi:MAG: dienelactone hydrolase family protein [Armatimonadetes bacterium]|nr:dienelactone hydrolase family protein [Armatimonadota bacterium]